MLTVAQALRLGEDTLKRVPDPQPDTLAILQNVTGREAMALRLNAQEPLTQEQEERFRSLLLLRAQREPLQYLLGKQCFYGYDFAVDGRVLIPRPETETLCELALEKLIALPAPRALDLCTGSGAIAVTLKLGCPRADVTACDLSADALSVARANAQTNGAEVRFLRGDLLAPVRDERFDVIVCNPPYVESDAFGALQPEVLREPRMALDGGADGLAFYRRLAADAPAYLAQGGTLMLEVGDGQAARVCALLADTGALGAPLTLRDLCGKERYVIARREAFPT